MQLGLMYINSVMCGFFLSLLVTIKTMNNDPKISIIFFSSDLFERKSFAEDNEFDWTGRTMNTPVYPFYFLSNNFICHPGILSDKTMVNKLYTTKL